MDALLDLLGRVGQDVWATVLHNWPFLLVSVVAASAIQVYLGTDRLAGWLRGRQTRAVVGAVGFGALTPFCSCGTTAVVLGAMASAVPWAPLVAFMVSSPLTSPSEYVLSVGLFGPAFATTFVVAAAVIGLAAGAVTAAVERTGVLAGQARLRAPDRTPDEPTGTTCCTRPDASATATPLPEGRTVLTMAPPTTTTSHAVRLRAFAGAIGTNGRRLAVYFLGFATIGYLLIEAIPTSALTGYLGGDSWWSVPLAAALGVPVYLNTEGSLPLVASLMDGGMGPGAALAFLVTGAGTSIGAVTGMLVIARWKVVGLVVGSLWVGAVALGYLAPIWL